MVYQLEEADTSIGRGEECSLLLDGRGISRLHARLTFGGGRPQLVDLDSSNGTFVNGLRLKPRLPQELKHGDVVRFGQARCTYSFELPPSSAQKSPKAQERFVEPAVSSEAPRRSALKAAKEAEETKEKPSTAPETGAVHATPATAAGTAAPCVNVLPVPYPFMQPPPPMQMYPPQFPQPPAMAYPLPSPEPHPPDVLERQLYPPRQRKAAPDESEMLHKQDLLLQRLWKLEEAISRLADANLEVCQRAGQLDELPDAKASGVAEQAEEAHMVAAALSAATDRLLSAESHSSPLAPLSPAAQKVADFEVEETRCDTQEEVQKEMQACAPIRSEEPEACDDLLAEMQRMLCLYEMVLGSSKTSLAHGSAPPAEDSSSSSGSMGKARTRPIFEGAVSETSVVLAAILSALDELSAMGYANPNVGGHRKWNALASERGRLAREEAIEIERLQELEEEETSLRQSTEAELAELNRLLEVEREAGDHPMFQGIPQTEITSQQACSHLQTELARIEADKARLSSIIRVVL